MLLDEIINKIVLSRTTKSLAEIYSNCTSPLRCSQEEQFSFDIDDSFQSETVDSVNIFPFDTQQSSANFEFLICSEGRHITMERWTLRLGFPSSISCQTSLSHVLNSDALPIRKLWSQYQNLQVILEGTEEGSPLPGHVTLSSTMSLDPIFIDKHNMIYVDVSFSSDVLNEAALSDVPTIIMRSSLLRNLDKTNREWISCPCEQNGLDKSGDSTNQDWNSFCEDMLLDTSVEENKPITFFQNNDSTNYNKPISELFHPKPVSHSSPKPIIQRPGTPPISSSQPIRKKSAPWLLNNLNSSQSLLNESQNLSSNFLSLSPPYIQPLFPLNQISPVSTQTSLSISPITITSVNFSPSELVGPFVGSFEESLLSGHMSNTPSISYSGFSADLGACGYNFIPKHVQIPFSALYYVLDYETPYVGTIELPKKGYRISFKGTIQVKTL